MKKILILTSLFTVIIACDKRVDFFKELNKKPELLINSKDNMGTNHPSFTDNIVDSFKLSQSPYMLNLTATDDNKGLFLNAFVSPSTGSNLIFNQSQPIINGDKEDINGVIYFTPSQANTYVINIEATDIFEETSTAQAKIVVFNNLPPTIPYLAITSDPNLNQYEYKFNASSAFDQDAKYGGTIIKYNWMVDNNYNVETEFNIIQYIFPGPGTYQVRVRCQDNDGDWSPLVTVLYSVL